MTVATAAAVATPAAAASAPAAAPRRRFDFIEVARVVCIFLVAVAHATDYALAGVRPTALTLVLSPSVRFVVPAFLMISGLLLGVRHRDPAFRLDAGAFWRQRVWSLVLPFVVWNLIYMVVFTRAYHLPLLGSDNLFNVTTGYMHLYFIIVLLQCLALYTLLAWRFSERLLKVAVWLAAAGTVAFYAVSEVLLWTRGVDQHWFEWHVGKLVFGWALFFFWGLWLGYREGALDWLRRNAYWLFLAALVAFVPFWLETRFQLDHFDAVARDYFLITGLPFVFLGGTALLGLLHRWEPAIVAARAGRVVVGWGTLMFGVYVSHLLVVHYLSPQWAEHLPGRPMALQIAVIALSAFFVSLGFVWLCGGRYLWPLGVVLFGGRGRKGREGAGPAPGQAGRGTPAQGQRREAGRPEVSG